LFLWDDVNFVLKTMFRQRENGRMTDEQFVELAPTLFRMWETLIPQNKIDLM
jgi:hypothetical protein